MIEKGQVFNASTLDEKKIFTKHDEMHDFSIVGDGNEVTIPTKYIPMTAGERIISTVGQKYVTSTSEYIWAVCTLGFTYWKSLRHKQKQRTAHILTNHRVVEFLVEANKGFVSNSLTQHLKIRVRSIYPGTVVSGYIKNDGKELTSSILTEAGNVSLILPIGVESAFFAQAMQSVSTRQALALDTNAVPELAESEAERLALGGDSTNELFGHVSTMPAEVCQLLPLNEGEKAIHYYDSGSHGSGAADGGRLVITPRTIMRINRLPGTKAKAKQGVSQGDDGSGTKSLSLRSSKFGAGQNMAIEPYFLLWVPAHHVNGQQLNMHSKGAHPVDFCCYTMQCIGVTKSKNTFDYRLQTKMGFTLPLFCKYSSTDAQSCCGKANTEDMPYQKNADLSVLGRIVGLIANTNDIVPTGGDLV